jgi:6,7-dimethyl-8-ribityllumazine synthase
MPRVFEGGSSAEGKKIALVVSQFNQMITQRLLDGAVQCLQQYGSHVDDQVDIFYCPGAFEIPQVASQVTSQKKYDAVVCLGAIIRGETSHFDFIAQECARGIGAVAREKNIPCTFGVLTTDTFEQAMERSGGTVGNKGWEAARSAISMVNLYAQLSSIK